MVFAIAIIWMSKSGSSKTLLILLFGGGVICAVFVFANRPLGGDQSHRLRVTVLDPNHVPVNRAHVWSTLGGEVKQVDGGWEIELPSMPGSAKRQATIRAEVADSAWRGETQVEFGNDFVPPVTVQLESSGEARIRGVVVDENDDAVPRAFVTVSGFETMSTDANGSFNLSAHVAAGKDVQLRAEKPGYTSITRTLQAGDTPVSIVLKHKGAKQPPSAPAIQKTGDAVIDRVIANLAELQRLDRAPAESRLAEVLAPLFNRPAFYGMTEGDWRFFLYPLCRTRLMLEQHVGSFKSHPEVREKITLAIQTMVEVQNSVAKLYGPNFSISQHISRYINTQKDFTDNLPPIVESPTVQFIQDRDQQIRRIRELLRSAGFPIK